MKPFVSLFPVALILVISGCGSTGISTRALYDAAGAAGGGYLAHELSDGDPLITAAGAAGGALAAEVIQNASRSNAARQARAGYEKGSSDTTKDLYWAAQRRETLNSDQPEKLTRKVYYPVEVDTSTPELDKEPQTILVPIEEPR